MTGLAPVPMFDVDMLPAAPGARLEALSGLSRPFCDFSPLNWRSGAELVHSRIWLVDRLILSDVMMGPHAMERRLIHLRKFDKAYVVIRLHIAGTTSSEVGTDAYSTRQGELHLVDFTETYSGVSTASRVLSLMVAHEVIGYDPARHPAHMWISSRTAEGALAAGSFRRLFAMLPHASLPQAREAAAEVLDLLRAYLVGSAEGGEVAASITSARRSAMHAFVEKSLQSPEISAGMLEREFRVSRATVYRDLECLGGLQRYLLRRRLEEACKELAFGPDKRGVVKAASERWHFSSVAHFSREFRRHFGFSPAEAVGSLSFRLAPTDPGAGHASDGIPAWFRRL